MFQIFIGEGAPTAGYVFAQFLTRIVTGWNSVMDMAVGETNKVTSCIALCKHVTGFGGAVCRL